MRNGFIQEKIDNFLQIDEKTNKELLNQLILYVYSLDSKQNDLYILAKLLPNNLLNDLISYFDGDTLNLPSKEEFRHSYVTAVALYLKEVLGYSWVDIKFLLELPENDKDMISSISIGRKINNIKASFNNDIIKLFKKIKIDNEEIKNVKKIIAERENG